VSLARTSSLRGSERSPRESSSTVATMRSLCREGVVRSESTAKTQVFGSKVSVGDETASSESGLRLKLSPALGVSCFR